MFIFGSAPADTQFGVELIAVGFVLLLGYFVVTAVLRAFGAAKPARRR